MNVKVNCLIEGLDQVLNSRLDLWDHYLASTANLLQQAQYDPSDYRIWAENG